MSHLFERGRAGTKERRWKGKKKKQRWDGEVGDSVVFIFSNSGSELEVENHLPTTRMPPYYNEMSGCSGLLAAPSAHVGCSTAEQRFILTALAVFSAFRDGAIAATFCCMLVS